MVEKIKEQRLDLETINKIIKELYEHQLILEDRYGDIHFEKERDQIEKNVTAIKDLAKELKEKLTASEQTAIKLNKKLTASQEAINKMQNNIFAIMTLFFGVFSFISINLNFTKSIFSYSTDTNINGFVLVLIFIMLQIIFFTSIYIFLLRPFLTKKPIEKSKTIDIPRWLYILHICLFSLSVLGLGGYIFDNYKLYTVNNPPVKNNSDLSLDINTSDNKKQQE